MTKFSEEEKEAVHRLAQGITNACQNGRFRNELIMSNLQRRMDRTGNSDLRTYLNHAYGNDEEFWHLISALTIHTTAWFREMPHFERLEKHLFATGAKLNDKVRILSAACSSGEEVYSFGAVLESFRQGLPGFEYEITGVDIDPISIQTAAKAIYSAEALKQIPLKYRKLFLLGSGKTTGLLTVSKDVRERCKFSVQNLLNLKFDISIRFNAIVCRNVLIYFSKDDTTKIIERFMSILKPNGLLCLGHSEAIDPKIFKLRNLGNAVYTPINTLVKSQFPKTKGIKVLVVDDSPTVIKTIQKNLSGDQLEVAAVSSAAQATEYLSHTKVDLITLDLNMPGMSGQEWLKIARDGGLRTPVLIITGTAREDAKAVLGVLETGAQDFVEKSVLHNNPTEVIDRVFAIVEGFRDKSNLSQQQTVKLLDWSRPDILLLGASTGGTQVLVNILKGIGPNSPPVLVTQHITASFARAFAERLALTSCLKLQDPSKSPELENGCIYLALDDYHLVLEHCGTKIICKAHNAPSVNRHRPSVDALFKSAAKLSNTRICAALLTGMGVDGAEGLLQLRKAGANTIAQDESSSIVFGMPKEAIKRNAAQFVGTPYSIRQQILHSINMRSGKV